MSVIINFSKLWKIDIKFIYFRFPGSMLARFLLIVAKSATVEGTSCDQYGVHTIYMLDPEFPSVYLQWPVCPTDFIWFSPRYVTSCDCSSVHMSHFVCPTASIYVSRCVYDFTICIYLRVYISPSV